MATRTFTISVEYEWQPYVRGSRNSYGVPEEPDDEECVIIDQVFLDGREVNPRDFEKELSDIIYELVKEESHG